MFETEPLAPVVVVAQLHNCYRLAGAVIAQIHNWRTQQESSEPLLFCIARCVAHLRVLRNVGRP
jgi:hypothetical protein